MNRYAPSAVGRLAAVAPPLLAACLAVAAAGCGPDGGIVLEIHRAPGVGSDVRKLELVVGVGHDDTGQRAIDPAWWLARPIRLDRGVVELPDGLGGTTLRYKLEDSDGFDRAEPLVIAVIGYGDDADAGPVLFGHTPSAGVRFADGEVRVIDVPLDTYSEARAGVGRAGCVWWSDLDASARGNRGQVIVPDQDSDCDGWAEGHDEMGACQLDCDDTRDDVHPGAAEVCEDGIDQNCCSFDRDGAADVDGDGKNGCSPVPDCVELPRGTVVALDVFDRPVKSEDIHPGALELCDTIDNDCSGVCDDGDGIDPDQDGWFNCRSGGDSRGVHRVEADRCVGAGLDCLEAGFAGPIPAREINPGASDDQCDQVDNDCSGSCDDAAVAAGDTDMDGFPACGTGEPVATGAPGCGLRHVSDCDDGDQFARPGVVEHCDGVDSACDGVLFDHGLPCFVMSGNRCALGVRACNDQPGAVDPIGACLPDPGAPQIALPPGFCTATCPPDDPGSCLVGERTQCKLTFPDRPLVPTTLPCPIADILLPSDPLPTCGWLLVGGNNQGDWRVTLVRDGLPGTSFDTCMGGPVSLRVVAAAPDAADRNVLILRRTGHTIIELRREDIGQCSVPPAPPLCQPAM